MVKAFVELLSGIVRVGPQTEKYGDPYEYAAAFSVDGDVATIKGLVNGGGHLTVEHFHVAKRELEKLGLKVRWERKR